MHIGIDLGGTKIEIVALEGERELLRERIASPSHDYAALLSAVVSLVERAEAHLGRRGSVGVGGPGSVSAVTGLMRNANSTVLNGRPLEADLSRALGRPIRLANDADCLALSEAVDGVAAGAAIVFAAILGTGVGGGLVVNGELLRGRNAIAGEWGHNPLPWPAPDEMPGPPCYCGKYGCIETFLSGPGMARDHRAHGGEPLAADAIVGAASAGDPAAAATLERYRDRLARAFATVVNLLDPDVVVLGGGVSKAAAVRSDLARRVAPYAFTDRLTTRFLPALHGDSSGVRGAARLWRTGPHD